ncbi:glycoside hydrolase family 37 [Nibricoccus aquaticus]|uniref:Glycoside hydrolase family 37 n=1 Tax=Nibricoccus aquaticus TaxID=2576891 RepID=A0A290Q905_9BACT|nr:trehalase family glycosidase [Nibricoccus aquaticus]ATC65195.1 glycoside hydrolase family 37 [Nibricoccus aquaticus]
MLSRFTPALLALSIAAAPLIAAESSAPLDQSVALIRKHLHSDYAGMFRSEGGAFKYPFITPGSAQYGDILWDWDSWLSNIALRQILTEKATAEEKTKALKHEQGCVLNYLNYGAFDGWVPIILLRNSGSRAELMKQADTYATNMHKPCLAQHAAFITKLNGGDAEWLREGMFHLQSFVNRYKNHQRHAATGLYFWNDDMAIGVDNDPSTYMRPAKSSGSIFLNCLMYRELLALAYLCERLGQKEIGDLYAKDAEDLKSAVQKHCWDERDGFFYSVDLNLLPYEGKPFAADPSIRLHAGYPRDYDCLIQRIDVWSGFLPLWAEIATPEQAKRMVERYRDTRTFNAAYGVRTLSKLEKMYNVRGSGNPSLWTGPIWGVSNYLVFRGLVKYGFKDDARDLADKTIRLFGRDFERFGALHEYYLPDSGEPVLNRGFQNWNYLVLNMAVWREGGEPVAEF